MKPIRPTAKALNDAFARRDDLAQRLADLDRAIAAAGRAWSRQLGNIVPLRTEALRRAIAQEIGESDDQETRQRAARK